MGRGALVIAAMVEYFYTGVLVEECDIVALLTLADRFQVDVLVETCAAEALRHLVCENVVAVVRAFRPLAPRPETASCGGRCRSDRRRPEVAVCCAVRGVIAEWCMFQAV